MCIFSGKQLNERSFYAASDTLHILCKVQEKGQRLVFVFMVRTNTLGLRFFEVSLVCLCKFPPWAIDQSPNGGTMGLHSFTDINFNHKQITVHLLQTKQLSSPLQYETHRATTKRIKFSHVLILTKECSITASATKY